MHSPENPDHETSAAQAAIIRVRAINESERRLAAAIDAATTEAGPTDLPRHSEEDAFAIPAPTADPSAASSR